MSIIVGRVENKFWENGGFKFPNSFPQYSERLEIKDAEPNLNDFLSGTIYLHGEHGNHCLYKGAYYNLHVFQVIDEAKKYYLYRLERDLWFDILRDKPRVVGDLSTSNNDELLEANLNRTFSMLDNPARVVSINFGDVEFDWKKFFTFKEATKVFEEPILTENALNYFFSTLEEPFVKNGKEIDKICYRGQQNPAVFILNYIAPHYSERNGKNLVTNKVNQFIKSIPTDEGNNLKIAKVTAGTNGKLQGNYCITHKVDGISSSEENVRLSEINLSGLEDIVPVNIHDLAEIEPYTQLGKGSKGGIFTTEDVELPINRPLFKIARRAGVPIGSNNYPYYKYEKDNRDGGTGGFNNPKFTGKFSLGPQLVNGEYGGRSGKFNLGWVDNINFNARYFADFKEDPLSTDYGHESVRVNFGKKHGDFAVPVPGTHGSPLQLKENYVTFGFFIFGLVRKYDDGNLFEYKGNVSRKEVKYGSGVSSDLFKNYGDNKSQGGSNIDPKLRDIQPTEELTKFYLDNFNFLWLSFFPKTNLYRPVGAGPDYKLYYDHWGTGKHTNNYSDPDKVIRSDIHDIDGNGVKQNPYSDERFPAYQRRVDQKLEENLLTTILELPEGFVLEKGDYFFNAAEYAVANGRRAAVGDNFGPAYALSQYRLAPGFQTSNEPILKEFSDYFILEDFVEHHGFDTKAQGPDNSILLCTDLHGGIDIRTLKYFLSNVELSKSDRQVVKDVEGGESGSVGFLHFKKIAGNLLGDKGEIKDPDSIKVKIAEAFYKAHGYKTKIIGDAAHGNGFDENDFASSSNAQLLFDLVGTDGYAFFAKGKVNLIAKSTKHFTIQTGKTTTLLHSENKGIKPTLLEKINQRVRLQFFEAPYYLNWKTTFSDSDKINLSFETMATTELPTNFEQYFLRVTTGYDEIFYENVSVPKKQTKALSPGDSVQIERFNLDLTHAQYGYQIDQNKLAIATKRYEEAIKRMEVNLQHQRIESLLSLGTTSAASGLGAGLSLKYGGGAKTITITNRKRSYQKFTGISEDSSLDAMGALALRFKGGYALGPRENLTRKVITKPGKIPNVAAATGALALNMTKNLIMDHAFRFPELERQIGFEKQIGASELALQSLGINTSFMERQINDQLALNQITNVYDSPVMNERRVLDEFMSKSDGHGGKVLKPAHLMVFIPSEEQLIRLRSFKEEYGVMCDIPDVAISFFEGMKPDVIRYRNLDKEAIQGIKNQVVLEYFRSRLLAGIHIVGTMKQRYNILTVDEYREKVLFLTNKLSEETSKVISKDNQITVLKGNIANIEVLLDKVTKELKERKDSDSEELKSSKQRNREIRRELEEARNQILALNEDKDRIQALIAEKEKQIQELTHQGHDDKLLREVNDRLNEEVRRHKVDLEECTQKLNDALRRAIVEKAELDKLKKESGELKGVIDYGSLVYRYTRKEDFERIRSQINDNQDIPDQNKKQLIEAVDKLLRLGDSGDQIRSMHGYLVMVLTALDQDDDSIVAQPARDAVKELLETRKEKWMGTEDGQTLIQLTNSLLERRKKNLRRIKQLSQGSSGLTPESCQSLTELIRADIMPPDWTDDKISKLMWEFARRLSYLRKTGLDRDLMRYPELTTMMEQLDGLTILPGIDYAMDQMSRSTPKNTQSLDLSVQALESQSLIQRAGGTANTDGKRNLKRRLDELNGSTFNAMEALKDRTEDENLRLLFKHIYPSKLIDAYKEAFGDPSKYIARRRYAEENIQCSAEGKGNPLNILDDYKTKALESINKAGEIPTTKLTSHLPTFMGLYLDPSLKYAQNTAAVFEDAKAGYSFSRGSIDRNGMGQICGRFWNYPYEKSTADIIRKNRTGKVKSIWVEFVDSRDGKKYDKFYFNASGVDSRKPDKAIPVSKGPKLSGSYDSYLTWIKNQGLTNREAHKPSEETKARFGDLDYLVITLLHVTGDDFDANKLKFLNDQNQLSYGSHFVTVSVPLGTHSTSFKNHIKALGKGDDFLALLDILNEARFKPSTYVEKEDQYLSINGYYDSYADTEGFNTAGTPKSEPFRIGGGPNENYRAYGVEDINNPSKEVQPPIGNNCSQMGMIIGVPLPNNSAQREQLKRYLHGLRAINPSVKGVNDIRERSFPHRLAGYYFLSGCYKVLTTPGGFEHPHQMFGGGFKNMINSMVKIINP